METVLANQTETSKPLKISEAKTSELKEALMYVMVLIGVPANAIPEKDSIHQQVLLNFINTYHGSLTLQDIKLAFEYAVAGKYEVNVQLYDKVFNAELFGRVIAEYKKYKAKQNAQPKAVVTTDKPLELNMTKMTPEQSFKNICEFIEKENKLPLAWDWDNVFFHCEAMGLISDTNEEKQMFMDAEVEKLRIEQKQAELAKSSLANSIKSTLEKQASIKQHCKRERVIVFLRSKYGI